MINKLVRIKVQTPKGERTLLFTRYDLPETDGKIPCTNICPYKDICEEIPHPEYPNDPAFEFTDFCGNVSVGEETDKSLDLIPVKGTVESNLKDLIPQDVFQRIIEKGRLVPVKDFIDNACSEWCDYYNKDYSNCTMNNASCMLQNLFMKRKITKVEEPQETETKAEDGKDEKE